MDQVLALIDAVTVDDVNHVMRLRLIRDERRAGVA
jgi:hypothetical protein